MTVLSSRNWRATEGTDFSGGDRKLVVTGEVEMSQLNETPRLTEASPQGINPSILVLNLDAVSHGNVGGQATSWEPVTFEKPVEEDQYSQVQIDGHSTVDVEKLIS